MAIRNGDYKFVLAEQRATSTYVWQEPLVKLRLPKMFNLRRDPFERADSNSNVYWDWMMNHIFMLYEMQAVVAAQIEDFAKFPPRQKPASFNLDGVMAQVVTAAGAARPDGKGAGSAGSRTGETGEFTPPPVTTPREAPVEREHH
jgi:arylsulfatase